MDILTVYFRFLAFAFPLFLIWPVVRVFIRVKVAQDILGRSPEQRNRLMRAHRSMLLGMRLSLWLFPIVTFLLALAHWIMPNVIPWAMFVVLAEGMIYVALQYSFEKWLVGYVSEHEKAAPG